MVRLPGTPQLALSTGGTRDQRQTEKEGHGRPGQRGGEAQREAGASGASRSAGRLRSPGPASTTRPSGWTDWVMHMESWPQSPQARSASRATSWAIRFTSSRSLRMWPCLETARAGVIIWDEVGLNHSGLRCNHQRRYEERKRQRQRRGGRLVRMLQSLERGTPRQGTPLSGATRARMRTRRSLGLQSERGPVITLIFDF